MAVCFCQQILEGGNETVVTSSVTFAPVPEDDNTMLKCQGDNPSLPGTGLEDSFLLNIVCKYCFHSISCCTHVYTPYIVFYMSISGVV